MAEAGGNDGSVRESKDQNGLKIHLDGTEVGNEPFQQDKEEIKPDQSWTEIKVEDADDNQDLQTRNAGQYESLQTPQSEDQDKTPDEASRTDYQSPGTSTSEVPQQPPPPPEKDNTPISPATTDGIPPARINGASAPTMERSQTQSTVATNNSQRSPISSMVFVVTALEQIAASKEARRKGKLGDSTNKVLTTIRQQDTPTPEDIFEPLRLATETSSIPLTTTALDCIGKLISYSYFSLPPTAELESVAPQPPQPPLIERAIETICDCFQDEATPVEIQLQIVKSLLAAVLNDKIIVHGAGLLKAVRQVYHIFQSSKSTANQQVAQGTLMQMVGTVFERVNVRLSMKEARLNMSRLASEKGTANASQADLTVSTPAMEGSEAEGTAEGDGSEANSTTATDHPVRKVPGEMMTLQSFENAKSFDDAKIGDNAPTMVTRLKPAQKASRTPSGQQVNGEDEASTPDEDEEDEIYVKDAFLVFRSMCRLSIKILSQEQQQDTKSSIMRSKLVSLCILRTLINNNLAVFTSPLVVIRGSTHNEPTSFGQAINQYLRLSLSRNGASSVPLVFETCIEIFWLILKDMRAHFKVYILWSYPLKIHSLTDYRERLRYCSKKYT